MGTFVSNLKTKSPVEHSSTSFFIYAGIIWQVITALGSIGLSLFIFRLEDFGRLGQPVQYFTGLIALTPAAVAAISNIALFRKKPIGRYLALALNFGGMVLAAIFLLHLWGVFLSFERIVDAIMQNAAVMLGFALAYGLYWIAGLIDERNPLRERLEMAGIGIGMLTLIILLFQANILGGINAVLNTYDNPVTWGTTIALIIFGIMFFRMLSLGARFGETIDQRSAWQGWLMLSPNIIGFLLFFAGPLLLSLYLSFTDSALGKVPQIIGFQNYIDILSLEFQTQPVDAAPQSALSFGYTALATLDLGNHRLVIGAKDFLFWISLRNTLLFCLLLVPLSVLPGLGLSLILNSALPGVKFFRALYFLPSVAAVVGTALIWRWLYDPTIGYINYTIRQIINFLNDTLGAGLSDPNIAWLTGPGVVLISIVLLAAWQVMGYNTVLFLAGLQGIPRVLYEAATVDGANRWQQFRNVTLPMLAPTTFFVIITTIITGLQVFNEPFTLFPSRPLPINATTSVFYLYERGFMRFQFGYASGIAWVLFFVIFLVTLIQFRIQRSQKAYEG